MCLQASLPRDSQSDKAWLHATLTSENDLHACAWNNAWQHSTLATQMAPQGCTDWLHNMNMMEA